jgi:glyoxylase-like metal-dependent hydrolase (beta-lactamase superfamily II)
MQRWRVGEVTITKVCELEEVKDLTWLIQEAGPEALAKISWLAPHFVDEKGVPRLSIHTLLVETPDRRILVDTCIGNDKDLPFPDWQGLRTSFLSDLGAAGFAPDSIDTVLCTHLHVDHVGWNTRLEGDRWVPTFPNARYLWNRAEYDYWSNEGPEMLETMMAESVRPVMDAGLVDLVSETHGVCDEVRLTPTPGHTPGHVSVEIESAGERAVITGDLLHHPAQCAHPEWGSQFDTDADQSRKTREDFLGRCADQPVLVVGTHFAGATAGRVVRDGDAYRLDADWASPS